MVEFQEKCSVTSIEQLSFDVFRISLYAPTIAAAANPGQFVMVRVTDQLDPLLRRPFSLHALSSDGVVSLLFKVVGKGTQILSSLRKDDGVDLLGPLGKGYEIGCSGPVCMIGGGMGIAPLLFLAQRFAQKNRAAGSDYVLLGARNQEEISPLFSDFSQLGYSVQGATDDGSFGHHGFVPALLDEILPCVKQVYTCGPQPMMRVIAEKCKQANVGCQVSLEAHMACGLGACLGCTVAGPEGSFIHVCKQGPVFDAREVAW